ncbi:putative tetratricopeptide-like helical domain superfamily, pentacotripeptide-repeat region of PRORP [Helianthus annuus]|nr:putative tetratricopeptide-like helical domain superfamily, pentacotripeptide-repeat region of PRORP [Helianthus annuus]
MNQNYHQHHHLHMFLTMSLRLTHSRITHTLIQIRTLCSSSSPNETLTLTPTIKPSPDADRLSQILIHHHNPFHSMESSLQLNGITLSHFLVHQTLIRLKHTSKIAFSFFRWAQTHPNYTHTTSTYTLIIDILGKVKQFDTCWKLITEMDSKGINPNFTTFYVLIRRLVSAGLTKQAVRAFDDIGCFVGNVVNGDVDQEQMEQQVDDFCYLFDTLCKYGYPKVAAEMFNKWKGWRFKPDVKMYTVLINGWWKVKNGKMAERFFNEMVASGIEPNVVTYNVVLNGMCRRVSLHPEERFERTVERARKVFDEMAERGVQPDVTSYSILLHVYSRGHKPDGTLEILKTMKDRGIHPSLASYTSVVKCLCSCGRVDDAYRLLDEMVQNGVTPSATTYNCFFKEYRGRKDVESALSLFKQMKKDSVLIPDTHTSNILLGMFIKLDRFDLVKEIWDDMKGSGSGPDLDSYTLLVHHLCDQQKWQEACGYFVEMIEKGILPQKVTFETLYRGLIQADMLRTWRRLKKKLDDEFVSFSSEFENYHIKPYKR